MHHPLPLLRDHPKAGELWAVAVTLIIGLCLSGVSARADSRSVPAAPAGRVETGAPSFVVLGPEALGLSTAPVDLHLLPDGRILVVSQHELAFGDGVRWETFREVEGQSTIFGTVAVDKDGQIYCGVNGGFARINLDEGGRWHQTLVMNMPEKASMQNSTMVKVTTFPDQWYWFGSNDVIVSWRPGQTARFAGGIGAIDRIYQLGQDVYLSDQSSGQLYRLKPNNVTERVMSADILVSESVTCAIPFGPGQMLVGTVSGGLKLFDGNSFHAFGPPGLLRSGHRITDLCPTGEGYYAAAIDTVGIVFFDREGHTVQVLERSVDHRLARVQRLQYGRDGVLWAQLNDGLVRVEFPSPISHYEPLLAGGLAYAQPMRHAGQLWILADGRAMRGIYDASDRLERFEDDTPPGRYLFTLAEVDGHLFGANDAGVFIYEKTGWRLALPGIMNARIGAARSTPGRFFYVARGEYGLIQQSGQNYTATRIPAPDLGDSYNAEIDCAGIGWVELGMSRIGRLDPNAGEPKIQILGVGDGLTDGWVELYILDGIARFHVANHHYRFDEIRRKFVEDTELIARYPQLALAGGRPVTDSLGRLWYTLNGATEVIDRRATAGKNRSKIIPVGFSPTGYTTEDDGVVWMFEKRRLARMDLRLPAAPPIPLRTLITSVEFPASNRELFSPGTALESLSYADNSLVFHFAAPANPFASPITFEVLLEGAGSQWLSTGAVGSARFNRLKEGDYVFRVRPVIRGTAPGAESRLQFTVRPPWFRTRLAWLVYSIATVALFAFVTWLSSYLQRRENTRLELLVGKRTAELNVTNARLGRQIQETTEKSAALSISEDRYRTLNAELESRVQERTAKLAEASGLLDSMLENTPDLVYFKDRESRFVRFSRAFATRFNVTDPTLIRGKTDFDFFDATHARPAYEDEQQIVRTGQAMIGKLEKETYADGHITWALTTKMPWRDGSGAIIGTFGISKDVTVWKAAEAKLAESHKQLLDASRQAGMAEVATGVLHNVGNVLNSLNVSATVLATGLRQSKADSLIKVGEMLRENSADLGRYLTHDPKGRLVPGFLESFARHFAEDRVRLLHEIESLQQNVEHIKEIVTMQQAYATMVGIVEPLEAAILMEDSLRMNSGALVRHDVRVVRDFQPVLPINAEKGKVLQILVNLIRNGKYACDEGGRPDKVLTLRITSGAPGRVRLIVQDNGIGIAAEHLTSIFQHGFTTRATGHGFGLHSSANAAKEMKGRLTVHSDGLGCGATFTLDLPVAGETLALAS